MQNGTSYSTTQNDTSKLKFQDSENYQINLNGHAETNGLSEAVIPENTSRKISDFAKKKNPSNGECVTNGLNCEDSNPDKVPNNYLNGKLLGNSDKNQDTQTADSNDFSIYTHVDNGKADNCMPKCNSNGFIMGDSQIDISDISDFTSSETDSLSDNGSQDSFFNQIPICVTNGLTGDSKDLYTEFLVLR